MRSSAATVQTVLRCSSANLSKNTVATAIAKPARTRCQRGHRERKRSCAAPVSTVGARGSTRADFTKNNTWYVYTSSFPSTAVKNFTWLQYKKRQIKAPRTTLSDFVDEAGMEGGHGNCCRFATLTGVHQGAHICLAKLWIKGKVRS